MARALYKCNGCKSVWQAATPATARLGTGRPVYCRCGEIATLKEIIQVEISQVNPKTAKNILSNEADWAEDTYHQNILMGARALQGSPDWTYHTEWSSGTTLWWHSDGKSEARVSWDEKKGWVVQYGR